MAESANVRLNKVLRELNISLDRAVDFLKSHGHEVEARPTAKISNEVYQVLLDEFQTDMSKKVASQEVGEEKRKEKEAIRLQLEQEQEERRLAREKRAASAENIVKAKVELTGPKTVGKIDLNPKKKDPAPVAKEEEAVSQKTTPTVATPPKKEVEAPKPEEPSKEPGQEKIATQYQKLTGPKITGDKIDLSKFQKPKKKKEESKPADSPDRKKRRRRIVSNTTGSGNVSRRGGGRKDGKRFAAVNKVEPSEEDVQKQVRETLEKLQGKTKKGKGAKYRRDKRDQHRQQTEKNLEQQELESKILKVTEFVTASEVATMMGVSTTNVPLSHYSFMSH
ncbi:MAG: translation initiation factor IF-2, partial [Bacteroidota bacterium]